jgi:adenylyltransferase/sulfurtransferase
MEQPMSDMTDQQLLRYSRQLMLPELDITGQQKLLDATAVVIGMGGLGAPVAMYLAAAGVGTLVLVDHDEVELSNLQRQIIHQQTSVGTRKVDSAAKALAALNPDIKVIRQHAQFDQAGFDGLVQSASIVVDATDNFTTRYQINAACWHAGVPLVSGAAIRWEGQVTAFDPRRPDTPCYQCLYPSGDDAVLNCSENGVIAPLVGIIGSCQALEVIKLLTGVGESLVGFLLFFDAKRMEWRKLKLPKNPHCPTCAAAADTHPPAPAADPH